MSELASRGQLRSAFFRWAIITVPAMLLLGAVSARLSGSGGENLWYTALEKPALNPPAWVFPVAWTILYVMMGLALALVINARGSRWRGAALLAFFIQLIANLAWSPVFFGMHRVIAALVVIVVMFVATAITIWLFARIRKAAALLMLPYLLWIAFAGFLTFRIHQLNPDAGTHLVPNGATTQITL